MNNSYTYISIDGISHTCIDYIMTSKSVVCNQGSVDKALDVKFSSRTNDHFPLIATLSVPAQVKSRSAFRRRVQFYDPIKIGVPNFLLLNTFLRDFHISPISLL